MTKQNSATLSETTRIWGKIGLLSFGGPAAQIALMHREIVAKKQWLSEQQFLNALNFCMLIPGPEAMQLATYAGWRMNGTIGGLIAGLLFVLPGALVIAALATIYVYFGNQPLIIGVFLGVKATVVIIVLEALLRVAKRALLSKTHYFVAAFAFIGIFFFNLPYPLIILLSALIGWFGNAPTLATPPVALTHSARQTMRTAIIGLCVWWAPIIFVSYFLGHEFYTQITLFFSKLAVVTFGGAYAVLAYMAQDVVTAKEWLTAGQMMDGLGLAETTPGPLILVTEFVGFLAGFQQGGIIVAFTAAFLTLWVTFAPCFLWIFVGAPYIEWIGNQPKLRGALSTVTAAVVGVILNLSLWFAVHVFFNKLTTIEYGPLSLLTPQLNKLNWGVVALALLSYVLLIKRHWNVVWVLLITATIAAIAYLI